MSRPPDPIHLLAEMLGAAELDCLDDQSNVWRSLMISARDLISKAPAASQAQDSLVTELEAEVADLLEVVIAFRDGGPPGGQDFAGWHESYGPAVEKARELLRRRREKIQRGSGQDAVADQRSQSPTEADGPRCAR